jgi:C-terminal processing protease CtpA/Prc
MRTTLLLPLALVLLLSIPALAGEHHSCDKPVEVCLKTMVGKLKSTGFIGVEFDKEKDSQGLHVSKVVPSSPAEQAGIQQGDVLLSLNGVSFDEANHEAMKKVKVPGREVTVTLLRNGASQKIKLTLAPMPADLMAKYIGEHMMYHAQKDEMKTVKR